MQIPKRVRYFLRLVPLAVVFLGYSLGPARGVTPQQNDERAPLPMLSRLAIPGTRELQLIIELTDPPVVQAMALQATQGAVAAMSVREGPGRINLQSPQAQSYRAQLARTQGLVVARLNALDGIQVQESVDLVMNAIIARVPVERYLEVRRLAGVKKVYFSRPHRMYLNAAAIVQNAAALWARAGGRDKAGLGVKIAIADTGIDITNPMFIDTTLSPPSGYPRGESLYTNQKVIVARNYINLLSNPQSTQTAVDEVGHGSFVAGCAAGKQVSAPLASISGMAPGAFLGNYKIFGTPGINDFTNTAAIVAALNAAVGDGMDVINLSLGSLSYVPPDEDPEVVAVNNATAAGTLVVLAAGNDGPATHTISNPGVAPGAITVGAVSNSRFFSAQVHVTSPDPVPAGLQSIGYTPGTGPVIAGTIPATPVRDAAALDGTGLGCSPFPSGSMIGRIGLLKRGTCTFATKIANATDAGAVAAIVYNNVPGEPPITMAGLSGTIIPAVMISYTDGLAMQSFLSSHPTTTVSIDASSALQATPTTPGVVLDFSSRGPSTDYGIKPDLLAVGQDVYSATQNTFPASDMYNASHFIISQGTSFSTAMVTGAAGAVKQLFPGLAPAALKSALVTTAGRNATTDGTTPATIVDGGSGLLDMGSASSTGAVFLPSSISFGVQSYSGPLSLPRTLAVTNISATADQFQLSVLPLIAGPVIGFSSASTGTIPPGGSASITVTLQSGVPITGGFQGWILAQSAVTGKIYQIPYWAGIYVPDAARILTVSKNAPADGVYGNLTDALRSSRPGNIIEIADSATYAGGLTISSNDEGLPLHGITIRAAAGQSPVLDGSATTAPANLEIVGLRDVRIQGITIDGGPIGVLLTQPSTTQPLSVTLDHCAVSNTSNGSLTAAVDAEWGGILDITYSTITGSSGAGVFVMNGARLTISNSTVSGNLNDGIDAFDSNVDLIGSTIGGNTGVGAYLVNCSGTADRNTFARNTGAFGDGLEIVDGTFTFTRNTLDANDRAGIGLFSETSFGPGPTLSIEDNTIQSNGSYGVLSSPAQNLRLSGNLIMDNGLGVRTRGTTSAVLVNNIIVRSRNVSQGSGVDIGGTGLALLVNNTIYKNHLYGITLVPGATLSVMNAIVSQNSGGDLHGLAAGQIQYSLIGDGTLVQGSNIQGDAKFSGPDSDDFSLLPGSPAIDAGSNAAAGLPFLDYSRRLRVAGAGYLPGDGSVDMGALEAGSTFPLVYPLLVNGYNPTIGDLYTTGVATLNASDSQNAAQFTAYGGNGTLIPGAGNPAFLAQFAAQAQIPILGYQLFGLAPGAGEIGGVIENAQNPLTGFFLIFDRDFQRLADGTDATAETATRLIFMRHQYDSAGKAVYALFNPGVNAATVNATVLNSSGAQIDVLSPPLVLAPKGSRIMVFDNVLASSGVVRVDSDRPISGVQLFGNTAEIAALRPVVPGTEARLYFPHIALNQGYTSTLGVVNTTGIPANLTLTAYRDDGTMLGTPASRSINGNGQLLESATTLFGLAGGALISGYVVVESDQPGITGFCSFRYEDGLVQSMAAVPAGNVPEQTLLFSHVAHQVPAGTGGNYITGIALLNPFGTRINYTMRVFDGEGREVAVKTDTLGPRQKISRILSHPIPGVAFFTQPIQLANGHIEVTTDYQLLGFELFFTENLAQLAAVVAQNR